MKKYILIGLSLVGIIIILMILALPKTGSNRENFNLSYHEFKTSIEKAKQKDTKAISQLLAYYSFYKNDRTAIWLIICHGKDMNITNFVVEWESRHKDFPECPEEPLNKLKY